uniref:4a-hydroxytetrahydrobiopterin dehydratase n=1 Tax=uncultured Thiotrichaceae bacterium TaxID=298394 RepID=A0A6S6TWD9_9GAMM|nr:MAG: 4a-hydroxytetrahydrobiopterin dehydratase [uncultured Thiotrichaceae bacterium]
MSTDSFGKEWKVTQRPPNITRAFQFDSYDKLRGFLDELAELSEQEGLYPNLNFTRDRATVTIQSDTDELSIRDFSFAEKTEDLFSQQAE